MLGEHVIPGAEQWWPWVPAQEEEEEERKGKGSTLDSEVSGGRVNIQLALSRQQWMTHARQGWHSHKGYPDSQPSL